MKDILKYDNIVESDNHEIELLRMEACFPVRDWPEAEVEFDDFDEDIHDPCLRFQR